MGYIWCPPWRAWDPARNFRPQMTGKLGIIHRNLADCDAVAAEVRRRPDFGLAVAERSGDTALAPGGAGSRGPGPPPALRSPKAIRLRFESGVATPRGVLPPQSTSALQLIRSLPLNDAARHRAGADATPRTDAPRACGTPVSGASPRPRCPGSASPPHPTPPPRRSHRRSSPVAPSRWI